ncbi:MAG TPA: molybdenum cofactor guanylyltransferase [Leucothrix mucor]|nr:molybdenum cofactor guanylyltransferase [Leucothrix mucor]
MLSSCDVTALILAGGQGSRLGGQDKGLVQFQQKPLIEHVLERIQPQLSSIIINANRNMLLYGDYGYPVISDQFEGYQGPLAGIESGLEAVATDYLLTLPCDGPFLPADLLERMLSIKNNSQAALTVAHDGLRMQSAYALIPVAALADLREYLHAGNRKLGRWLQAQGLALVDFSDQSKAFANINTESQKSKWE